ncbi:hematopoietic death receptor isoform X1 [Channa argus]|uniref:hematopoietic death receptor isoform X1 n=1 Tax=Channa argus TaxID=215402 RepID=UPI002945C81F|nr:hypothetical protein Q8A73_012275 [Channa argus]
MTNFLLCVVFSVFLLPLKPISAFPPSGLDFGGSRTQRDVHCSADLEYWHNNICCLNCPAGTHVKLACTSLEKKSQCEDCDYGTYTEHANGLPQCFKCTQCRSDQEIVRHCTTTQDAQCQCKPGWFCAPDQACEVCKRCSKCKKDEVIARNCTSTTDTECKEMQHNTGSVSANIVVILPIVLVILLITIVAIVILFLLQRKRCCAADSQNNNPAEVKAGESYINNSSSGERRETQRSSFTSWPLVRAKTSASTTEECKVLCESLNSSASNSQHSLTNLYSSAFPEPLPQAMQPTRMEDERLSKLYPVNGEVSLKKCFEYFEEIDINYHKRFFRHLGINDNVIKSHDHLPYEDRIHELLTIWVEKEGRDASLNDLLKALCDLNQRRTAETVMEIAVRNGHYVCEP